MIAMQQAVDYQHTRSLVKEAFALNDAPYSQSPGADYITTKPSHELPRTRTHYAGQAWNTRVHATESRRPGTSKVLLDKPDVECERMASAIGKLQRANKATLSYFYDSGSVVGKHPAKQVVWAAYLPSMTGCSIDTKVTGLCMLDHLLPAYRVLILQGETELPKQPWKLFPENITGEDDEAIRWKWYNTHSRHWKGLWKAIGRLDYAILDLVR